MRIENVHDEEGLFIRLNAARGMLSLVVLLSHIWGYAGIVFLIPFNKSVTIAVSGFFFLSGYGMERNFQKHGLKYLERIWYGKIPLLLYMALSAYFISALCETALQYTGGGYGKNFFTPFGFANFFKTTNWYVYELSAFYIWFIFCKKAVRDEWQLLATGMLSGAALIVLFHMGVVEAYYNSILGFWFGMVCYRTDSMGCLSYRKMPLCISGIVLVLSFAGMICLETTAMYFAVIRNLAAIAAIVVWIWVSCRIDYANAFQRYLSRLSPEVYFSIFLQPYLPVGQWRTVMLISRLWLRPHMPQQ